MVSTKLGPGPPYTHAVRTTWPPWARAAASPASFDRPYAVRGSVRIGGLVRALGPAGNT